MPDDAAIAEIDKELLHHVAQAAVLCDRVVDLTALSGTLPRSRSIGLELLTATRWLLEHDEARDVTALVREVREFSSASMKAPSAARSLERPEAAKQLVLLIERTVKRHRELIEDDIATGAQLVARDVAEGLFFEGKTYSTILSVLPRDFPTDDAVVAASAAVREFMETAERFSEDRLTPKAPDQDFARLLARKLLVAYGCKTKDMRAVFDGLERNKRRRARVAARRTP